MKNNIASERRRLGINQRELAAKLGCCKQTVSLYECGNPIPSDKLKEMADLFGCTTDYILARVEERVS